MRRAMILLVLAATVLALGGCRRKSGRKTIAVIPKGTTHEFWLSVKAGAVKAGKELDVNIDWIGPEKEDDRAQQISIVDNMILKGVAGIVLAPLDRKALVEPVARARKKGIPVVVIDSGLEGEAGKDYVSFVATNNHKGGQLGGERTLEVIGGKGKVIMLRYQRNSASTEERERGWLDVMKKHPQAVTVLSQEQHAGATKDSAQRASENLLDRFTKDGKLQADAVFCPNESSAYGMLMALQNKGLAGKVKYIGFDASKALIRGLYKGEMHGLVLQDPERMGYEGVKTMVRHLRGEKVDPGVDTGVRLITKDDLAKPETKALVPKVDEWLKDLREK